MSLNAADILMHYGVAKRSGRYPWGSGEDPYQHGSKDFLGRVDELRKSNFTYTDPKTGKKYSGDTAIAKSMGLSTTQFRTEIGIAKDERRMLDVETAKRYRNKEGLGATEIGRKMGLPESTVRSLLNEQSEQRMQLARNTANFIKEQVDKKGMVDVATGVEKELGISSEKMNQALYLLEREGYPIYKGGIPQATNPGQQTNQRVICKPGTKHNEIYEFDKVHALNEDNYTSHDGGKTFDKFVYPKSMDSKRLMIRYADDIGPDGARGIDKDGVIELRRGVDDLSLGDSHYAQVRILVDNKKYLKGMAVYSDNMPDGVDVIFNTNKTSEKGKLDVLKDIKDDPDNPFGSLIKANGQSYYTDKNGKKQLSLINKRADEGDWTEWKDALPSQFLGKQSLPMIKKQLNLAKADKLAEYDEICSLTNPTVKKHLLEKFADTCDSAAVHLQAAALPGQKYHVIIPINSLKDNEIYAPGYEPGTKVALIRYPHGGTFEIPILTVTHKNKLAKDIIGTSSIDAVGINKNNADRLSGADFDGDTVMVIPTHDSGGKVKITSTPELGGLKGFDPKTKYAYTDEEIASGKAKLMKNTGTQMGVISNLITDMTLAGANETELAQAVRHSMVVIDAEKHKLNYKQSEIDNNIAGLHKKYQGKSTGGAATILSRSKGEYQVEKRQGTPKINIKGKEWYDPSKPEGAKIYKTADDLYYPIRKYDKATKDMTITTTSGKKITYNMDDKKAVDLYTPVKRVDGNTGKVTYTNKTGDIEYKIGTRHQKSTKMAEADDAYELVSKLRNPKEMAYADYANSMKSLANSARKELMLTGKIEVSKSAKETYKTEVESLMSKLNNAQLNAPKERAAQRMANAEVAAKLKANPDIKKADEKKMKQQSIEKYRNEVGSVKRRDRNIVITDKEWEAIQAGAISENKLKQILNNTDIDDLRQRATPRNTSSLSAAQVNRIKALSKSNFTLAEIAKKMNISTSTASKYLKGAN